MVKIKSISKCLTLAEKAKLIEDSNTGMTVTALSKKYGIAKSTVCSIKNKKSTIIETVSNTLKPGKKCTLKKADFPQMEQQLYKWFLRQRERNMPLSGGMLKQKALSLSGTLNIANFTASDGWLQRFKERYGIRFLKITGEKLSSQPELIDPFKKNFFHLIKEQNLKEHQIYNADETGLYWRLLPDKTYVSLAEKTAPGLKIAKQRITFLACANSSGLHKLKPLIIGKAKNPRCFKNFHNPLVYRSTKNAWMTAEIFKNWFFQQFVPEVKHFLRNQSLPEKAILLLDNAPSHPPAQELRTNNGNIFVMFMPPNVTPFIQPMDQNALRLTKLYYRKSLLSSIVAGEGAIGEALKKLTLKDAVLHLTAAWEKLSPQVIQKCWACLMSDSSQAVNEDEDDLPLSVLQQKLKESRIGETVVTETITLLQALEPVEYTAREVEDWNQDNMQEECDDDNLSEESDCEIEREEEPKIEHTDAIKALNIAIEWARQNHLDIDDVLKLKNIHEKAVIAKFSTKQVQTKITHFYKHP